MEKFLEEYFKYYRISFDKVIQQYNSNTKSGYSTIDFIVYYKIENNKNIIYKEDIPKILSYICNQNISQEEFMENVMRNIKYLNLDINNLTIAKSIYSRCLCLYYMSTFLEHEPVDIKIALKD